MSKWIYEVVSCDIKIGLYEKMELNIVVSYDINML